MESQKISENRIKLVHLFADGWLGLVLTHFPIYDSSIVLQVPNGPGYGKPGVSDYYYGKVFPWCFN